MCVCVCSEPQTHADAAHRPRCWSGVKNPQAVVHLPALERRERRQHAAAACCTSGGERGADGRLARPSRHDRRCRRHQSACQTKTLTENILNISFVSLHVMPLNILT